MEIGKKITPIKFLIFTFLFLAILTLTACDSEKSDEPNSNTPEIGLVIDATKTTEFTPNDTSVPAQDQQNEVMIPLVESSGNGNNVSEMKEVAYPDSEQESLDSGFPNSNLNDDYPEPEEDTDLGLIPTPRGNELVATNPSTVNLASGQLQLVELFAFW